MRLLGHPSNIACPKEEWRAKAAVPGKMTLCSPIGLLDPTATSEALSPGVDLSDM